VSETGSDIRELTAELRKLVAKLDAPPPPAPKRKDWADRLPLITSFISTVVIALLGLYFTQSSQRAQLANARTQLQIEQFKALASVAPMLASDDSAVRATAERILEAVGSGQDPRATAGGGAASPPVPDARAGPAGTHSGGAQGGLSVFANYIRLAKDARASEAQRVEALQEIQRVATSPGASAEVREQALTAASEIAVAPGTPEAVRRTAADVITGIQSVEPGRIASVIAAAPLTRRVTEIVVHQVGPGPAYRGASTMLGLARFQLGARGWTRVSWHYAIAPDGTVWLGMPLNERANHVPRRNNESVSVLLIGNMDEAPPTETQQRVFGEVMRSVQRRVGLAPDDPDAARLHRDLPQTSTTCPGRFVTSELVAAWIAGR
jgi:hypothetical protein